MLFLHQLHVLVLSLSQGIGIDFPCRVRAPRTERKGAKGVSLALINSSSTKTTQHKHEPLAEAELKPE